MVWTTKLGHGSWYININIDSWQYFQFFPLYLLKFQYIEVTIIFFVIELQLFLFIDTCAGASRYKRINGQHKFLSNEDRMAIANFLY